VSQQEDASPQPLRIGMFGGAFDPPHHAHRSLAEAAVRQLSLDALHIVPTGQAWHKSRPLTPAEHRWAMCEIAFSGLPCAQLDDREIRRSGPTYTFDTLTALAQQYPGAALFLVLGGDQLAAFPTWHRWRDIARLAQLAVAQRELGSGAAVAGVSQVRKTLAEEGVPLISLDLPLLDISATHIRAQLAGRSSQPASLNVLVPNGVARYISEHSLYKAHA
jgi:nicotinate-nucleotide adenylyltransferase